MSVPALVVEELYKEFKVKKKGGLFRRPAADEEKVFIAVNAVSFQVAPGEVFGLLGPNGAGKTTTIKMISTLLRPTRGRVLVHGIDPEKEPTRVLSQIGTVLAGERCVYWKLTGRENLEYFGTLYGLYGQELKERVSYLLERFQLAKRGDELVERYSTGMRQRVSLARALLANPKLLILDEPTAGLDPQSARNLREIILELKEEGHTVLLTTHYMEEADFLSDRVAIIDHGKIIALDTPENLKRGIRQTRVVHLEVQEWQDGVGNNLRAAGLISNYVPAYDGAARAWRVVLHLGGETTVGAVLAAYLEMGNGILNFSVEEPSLEDVFIQLTGKSLRE
ncbi:MAG: ABC transporter ATP-binding protein [Bacillota bacterium]